LVTNDKAVDVFLFNIVD